MNRALFFSRCYYILIGVAVLSIPFTYLLYFFITPLLLIFWIIEGDWRNKWNRLKESNTLIIVIAFALYGLVNVAGLFHATDMVVGLMRTYDKLPFLVYPAVFFTLDKTFFTKEKVNTLFKGFLCATTLFLLICWGNSFIQYLITNKTSHFYYTLFSKLFGHPVYCAVIVCIAFCINFYFLNHSKKKHKWLWGTLLFFYGISIYFFQTRSGIFAFIIILILSLFYYVHDHKKEYGKVAAMFSAVLIIFVMLLKIFPNRVEDYVININNPKQLQEKSIVKKVFGARTEIWQITYEIAMKNKIFGIGAGYKNENYLKDDELQIINKYSLFINAHNQFLQTFLENGIIGLFILCFLIFYSFYYAIKTKNYFLLMLLILFFINILFESMFERHKGIFAFNLFYSLFVVKNSIFAPVCFNK